MCYLVRMCNIFGIDGLVWPDNHSNDFELIERASYTPKRRKTDLDYTHFGEEKNSNGCMLLHIHLKKKTTYNFLCFGRFLDDRSPSYSSIVWNMEID